MQNKSKHPEKNKTSQIIAYPTEAVYGLGCDPHDIKTVKKILELKQRPWEKGLIIIGSDWKQLKDYADLSNVPDENLRHALATWPGPYTWIFPAHKSVSKYLRGIHQSIALRVTAHPIANKLCRDYGHALVSTSANISNQNPAKTAKEVKAIFANNVDIIIAGDCGPLHKPTCIREVLTGAVIRA